MFLWLGILYLTIKYGTALTCLQCDGVSKPRHCRYVAECFDGEVCGIERVANTFGQSSYNIGCIHMSRCANSSSSSNTGSCHGCCSSNLCNAEGCGEIDYPVNRGPVCYYCPVQVDIKSCGTIEFCEQGELCSYSVRKEFGDLVYTSGCLNRHSCSSTGVSSAVLVGRDLSRNITEPRADLEAQTNMDKRSVKDVVCSGCCKEDLCNRDCSESDSGQTSDTTKATTTTPATTTAQTTFTTHTTTSTQATTFILTATNTQATTTNRATTIMKPCSPIYNCTAHYTCGSRGEKICRSGWTGQNCDLLISDGPADCNIFDTYVDWCGARGTCFRYGNQKNELTCCCDAGYSGNHCEVEIPTSTTTTTQTTTKIKACIPINNCSAHYTCGARGEKICRSGWTGQNCDQLIADGPADCNIFDQEELIPSLWDGNYTCNDDINLVTFRLNITRSSNNLEIVGNLLISNSTIAVSGAYASYFKLLSLQSQFLESNDIFTGNFTKFELNARLSTSTYIDGNIIFYQSSGYYRCAMELRRKAVYMDWCGAHATCFRYGRHINQFTCCCDAGHNYCRHNPCQGRTCLNGDPSVTCVCPGDGNTLTCLQCDGVSQPRHCRYVAECFDDEVCGVERVTNAFGQSTYNIGCIHTSRCANSSDSFNTGSCHECCSSNLCNSEGCGEIGYPINRGPVCYYCPVQVDIKSCGTIEFCEQGEVCSYNVRKEFGDLVYSSGCLNRHSCSSTGVSSAVIVGRDLSHDIADLDDQTNYDIRSVKDVVCSGCCKEDLCNRDCNMTSSSQAYNFCMSNPCQRGTCLNGVSSFTCLCPGGVVGNLCQYVFPTDCYDILHMGIGNTTDVYGIYLWKTHKFVKVLCDMDTDGGGWTVFQHRFNGSENFNRSFSEYTSGFGDPRQEYWLGLENIYELANITSDMRIELSTKEGNETYQLYNDFSLSPTPEYSIMFSSTNGTAGNGFLDIHPAFSSYDNEQDLHRQINCGQFYGAGWWYEDCRGVDLNAPICDDDQSCWRYHAYFGMQFSPLKTSMMMLRRV